MVVDEDSGAELEFASKAWRRESAEPNAHEHRRLESIWQGNSLAPCVVHGGPMRWSIAQKEATLHKRERTIQKAESSRLSQLEKKRAELKRFKEIESRFDKLKEEIKKLRRQNKYLRKAVYEEDKDWFAAFMNGEKSVPIAMLESLHDLEEMTWNSNSVQQPKARGETRLTKKVHPLASRKERLSGTSEVDMLRDACEDDLTAVKKRKGQRFAGAMVCAHLEAKSSDVDRQKNQLELHSRIKEDAIRCEEETIDKELESRQAMVAEYERLREERRFLIDNNVRFRARLRSVQNSRARVRGCKVIQEERRRSSVPDDATGEERTSLPLLNRYALSRTLRPSARTTFYEKETTPEEIARKYWMAMSPEEVAEDVTKVSAFFVSECLHELHVDHAVRSNCGFHPLCFLCVYPCAQSVGSCVRKACSLFSPLFEQANILEETHGRGQTEKVCEVLDRMTSAKAFEIINKVAWPVRVAVLAMRGIFRGDELSHYLQTMSAEEAAKILSALPSEDAAEALHNMTSVSTRSGLVSLVDERSGGAMMASMAGPSPHVAAQVLADLSPKERVVGVFHALTLESTKIAGRVLENISVIRALSIVSEIGKDSPELAASILASASTECALRCIRNICSSQANIETAGRILARLDHDYAARIISGMVESDPVVAGAALTKCGRVASIAIYHTLCLNRPAMASTLIANVSTSEASVWLSHLLYEDTNAAASVLNGRLLARSSAMAVQALPRTLDAKGKSGPLLAAAAKVEPPLLAMLLCELGKTMRAGLAAKILSTLSVDHAAHVILHHPSTELLGQVLSLLPVEIVARLLDSLDPNEAGEALLFVRDEVKRGALKLMSPSFWQRASVSHNACALVENLIVHSTLGLEHLDAQRREEELDHIFRSLCRSLPRKLELVASQHYPSRADAALFVSVLLLGAGKEVERLLGSSFALPENASDTLALVVPLVKEASGSFSGILYADLLKCTPSTFAPSYAPTLDRYVRAVDSILTSELSLMDIRASTRPARHLYAWCRCVLDGWWLHCASNNR